MRTIIPLQSGSVVGGKKKTGPPSTIYASTSGSSGEGFRIPAMFNHWPSSQIRWLGSGAYTAA